MGSCFAVIILLLSTALAYSQTNGRVGDTVLVEFGQPINRSDVSTGVFPGRSDAKSGPRTASVVVKLGPKAGMLTASVKDKVSGKPIPAFTFSWLVRDRDGLRQGTTRFRNLSDKTCHPQRINIPPTKDVSIVVTAPGYKKWITGPLNLQSGEEKALSVELQQ